MPILQPEKPRKFEYKPRFYDSNKEELEQLRAKYGKKEGEAYKRRIDIRAAMEEHRNQRLKKPFPILKIMLYILLSVGLVYLLLRVVETWV